MRTAALTALAMLAFASNSILCRMALGDAGIDAASFSAVRIGSGAVMLAALVAWRRSGAPRERGSWLAAAMLFTYVVCFSYAYLSLSAGTGALILFGAVQLTMILAGLRGGETLGRLGWLGSALALGGLLVLVAPGVRAPSPGGAALMATAGIAWGVYSLCGQRAGDPLRSTASNFLRAIPLAALALVVAGGWHASLAGILLAVASGAIASALGYTIWYSALRGLRATRAASAQLSVPVLAALGGVVLLGEAFELRLAIASVAVLGGLAMVFGRRGA